MKHSQHKHHYDAYVGMSFVSCSSDDDNGVFPENYIDVEDFSDNIRKCIEKDWIDVFVNTIVIAKV